MWRNMAAESEQLLGVVMSAALSHEEQYYTLCIARYLDARAEDMRRRQVELERSAAWAMRQQRGGLIIYLQPYIS